MTIAKGHNLLFRLEQMWAEDEQRGEGRGDHKVALRLANYYIDTNNKEQAVIWHRRAAQVGLIFMVVSRGCMREGLL